MKTLIIILLLLSSCAWSKTDKTLFLTYGILSAIDAVQTSQIDGSDTREGNPLFAKDNGKADMVKVIGVKTALALGLYFVADKFPQIRTEVLIGGNIVQGGVIIYSGFQF